jgi:hypothetical protein
VTIGQRTQAASLSQDWDHVMWHTLIYKTACFSSAQSVMGLHTGLYGTGRGGRGTGSEMFPISAAISFHSASPRDYLQPAQCAFTLSTLTFPLNNMGLFQQRVHVANTEDSSQKYGS